MVTTKLKLSLHRPGHSLKDQRGRGSQISRQSAYECGKFISPYHRPSLPPRNIPGTQFCYRLNRPHNQSAAGKIMSIKIYNDTVGNRNRDFYHSGSTICATACPLHHKREYIIFRAFL